MTHDQRHPKPKVTPATGNQPGVAAGSVVNDATQGQHQAEATSSNHKATVSLADQVAKLQAQLAQAEEKERRRLADYQNLVRRTQEDRAKLVKFATQDFVTQLLPSLDHLQLAADQLQDQGLSMVMNQLWQTLSDQGLEKLDVIGQTFDPRTMEAVETTGKGQQVTAVVSHGYTLNKEVVKPAKVVVGDLKAST